MSDSPIHASAARPWPTPAVAAWLAAAIVAIQAASLFAMGRPLLAESGAIELWHGAADAGQSQHLADWYTFTHVEHGLLFYVALRALFPRTTTAWRFVAAVLIEGAWEIFENTDFIIDRYRQSNLAQGYRGDSIVNSVADNLAMMLGFAIAARIGSRLALALVVAIEIFLAATLRDNLTLNVIALVHPIEAIERWQAGGSAAPQ